MKTARTETKKAPTRKYFLKARSKSKEKKKQASSSFITPELATVRINLSKILAESNNPLGKSINEGNGVLKKLAALLPVVHKPIYWTEHLEKAYKNTKQALEKFCTELYRVGAVGKKCEVTFQTGTIKEYLNALDSLFEALGIANDILECYTQKYHSDRYDILLYINPGRLAHVEELVTNTIKILKHMLKLVHYVRFRNAGTAVVCAIRWLSRIHRHFKSHSYPRNMIKPKLSPFSSKHN